MIVMRSLNPGKLFQVAWHDIRGTFINYHVITTMGWQDIATRYKRTRIGAFWLTIGTAVTIAALGFVFGSLFRQPIKEYLPFLTIGTLIWNLLSQSLIEGSNSFVVSSGIILQVRLPLFIHVMRVLWRNIIILGHNLLILPLVFLIFMRPVSLNVLLVIPGFLLLTANISWMMLALAIICARFRDVSQIVQSVIQIMYFVTPVMWNEKLLPARAGTAMLDYNPLYHLISIVRSPLLGNLPSEMNWIFSLILMVGGWILALGLFGRYHKRIPYWL